MINVNFRPIGRLGNMLFQAAAALGYVRKHGGQWGVQRNLREVPHFLDMFPNVPILDGEFKRHNRTDPSQFGFEEFPKFNQDTTLCGFFQSIKYFEHCQEDVKKMFKLDIKPVDAVSIHVRRGDYVTYSNSFPPVDDAYLLHATDFMDKMYVNGIDGLKEVVERVIVFSDDIPWCKMYFKKYGDKIEFSEGRTEFEDLSLMASCSHHIIANSTFSWWGAFLGHNPDKIVVSPHYENWFGPGFTGSAPKDLIPEGWHQIKFR